jgi:two-component system, chemotaxis family, CheB/CheR fusion protein
MPMNATMTIAFHDFGSAGTRPAPPERLARTGCARDGPSRSRDIVYLIDVDGDRQATRELCEQIGYEVQTFSDLPTFLTDHQPGERRCLLVDTTLLGDRGFNFIERLRDEHDRIPCIVMSAGAKCPTVVQAIKAGAFDFIEKPICRELFVQSLEIALNQADRQSRTSTLRRTAATRVATLTRRQHQILDLVLAGYPSKNIAADLGISQRTVENHRASIGRKTGSRSLSALIHTAIYADSDPTFSGGGLNVAA